MASNEIECSSSYTTIKVVLKLQILSRIFHLKFKLCKVKLNLRFAGPFTWYGDLSWGVGLGKVNLFVSSCCLLVVEMRAESLWMAPPLSRQLFTVPSSSTPLCPLRAEVKMETKGYKWPQLWAPDLETLVHSKQWKQEGLLGKLAPPISDTFSSYPGLGHKISPQQQASN